MALIKSYETPQGVTATYHRVIKAEMQMDAQIIEVVIAIYASPEARDAGRSPLWHDYIRIPFGALTMDPRTLVYPLIAFYGESPLAGAQADEPAAAEAPTYEIRLTQAAMQPEAAPQTIQEPAT